MIIPDICTNWHDLNEVEKMILVAKQNGASLVKGQLFDPEDDKGKPHYQWVKDHALTFEQAKELFDYGASIGIEVFFSVFGAKYVDWCERIGVKRYKIACQYRDKPVLDAINLTGKQLIYSTDIETLDPEQITGRQFKDTKTLYCVPTYPALVSQYKFEPCFFESARDCDYIFDGLSDHSIGLDIPKIALARGAQIIEKHFVLDRNSPAPDAPWSMTPDELKELVRWEAVCKEALG
jgi:sialic acid synthase SpsE